MREHPNFYENIKEADIRLRGTVVLYEGNPYYVLCITDHKPDGIFRMYLDPIGAEKGMCIHRFHDMPHEMFLEGGESRGSLMDKWMLKYPDSGLMRKMMNSPEFNRFRPFSLGMVNKSGSVIYLERQPTRHTQQGLTQTMMNQTRLSVAGPIPPGLSRGAVDLVSRELASTIKNEYPTLQECLDNLKDPNITNEGAAFHREFAIMRGPLDTFYLAYKHDIVGILPNSDTSTVRIAQKFSYTKEVVAELNVFSSIVIG